MKRILLFLSVFSFTCSFVQAQFTTLTVKDKETGLPIPYVSVYNEKKQEGAFSNEEGKIKWSLAPDTIILTHVAYENVRVVAQDYSDESVIYLQPKPILLDEVVIYNIDLKEILGDILKKYHKIYLTGSQSYTGTFKETYKVNEAFKRLSQFKIRFWHEDYMISFRKPFEKQYLISIDSVDYSKVMDDNIVSRGSIILRDIFKSIHLNYFILIMQNSAVDITIDSIVKKGDIAEVAFHSPVEENDKYVGDIKGDITFDKQFTKILELGYTYRARQDFEQIDYTEKDSIMLKVSNQSIYRHVTFIEGKRKLMLNYFNHNAQGDVQIDGDTTAHSFDGSVSLFIGLNR